MGMVGAWRVVTVAVVATCAAASGCGGDAAGDGDRGTGDDKGQTPAAAEAPSGVGAPDALAGRIMELLVAAEGGSDCLAVEDVNRRSFARLTCPPEPDLRRSMRKFEVTDSATYGSAAVVDYRSGAVPDGASVVLFAGPDGRWAISRFGLVYGPTVGTSDEQSREGFERAVAGYLRAVRERDCALFRRHAATNTAGPDGICKQELERTAQLRQAIAASDGAKPRYLGGNETLGFYSLTLSKPRPQYFTLSAIKAADGPDAFRALDAAPGPSPDAG